MGIQLKTGLPGPKSMEWMQRRKAHIARGPFHTTPIFVARAQGAILEDVDGNLLIDFASGIGVTNVGHRQNRVVEAIHRQTDRFLHSSFNVTAYEDCVRLAEKLNQITPGDFEKKSFFANTGAEAVENSIKMARAYTGRQAIVCFEHAFHGRTYMAMALTYKEKPYKAGFGPFPGEVYRAPFPYEYRWPTGSDRVQVAKECFQKFEELVRSEIRAVPAAIIIEPILGEGGFVPASAEFLTLLRQYCTQNQVVLIADEIQSAWGRTGALFACEHSGIAPDLLLTAKALGGGMPISAVTGRSEIMDGPGEGGIGGTFNGNPVSCAAALAVIEEFEQGDLISRSKKLGEILSERLSQWKSRFSVIGDVRGLGPMRAFELVKDRQSKEPFPEAVKKLVEYCYQRGLVIMSAGSYGNVVRLLMPLVIETSDLEEGLNILESGLSL